MAESREPTAPSTGLHVVLVHPEIPWNVGNAGRTCLATGARLHLVRPLGFSLAASAVRRAGLDYWEHVDPVVWPAWDACEAALPGLGSPFYFSAEGRLELWDIAFPPHSVLVFGRESVGLPAELRARHAASLVRIPMIASPVRSLNLSTSIAVSVFEVLRGWRASGLPAPRPELAASEPGATEPGTTAPGTTE